MEGEINKDHESGIGVSGASGANGDSVEDYLSPEDLQCAKSLLQLSKTKFESEKDYPCQTSYINFIFNQLQKHTKLWKMEWNVRNVRNVRSVPKVDFELTNSATVTYYTKIEWPMEYVIPLDFIPEIQNMIKRVTWNGRFQTSMITDIDVNYNRNNRELSFTCNCAFDLLDLVRCNDCGNVWDGNAQCLCHLE